MKTEDLKAQGLNQEQIDFVMKANGKDLSKLQDQLKKQDETISDLSNKLETANETVRSFKDVDVEGLQTKIQEYEKKIADIEAKAELERTQKEFDSALKGVLSEFEFSSEGAKRDVIRQIKEADLKVKDGKIIGINDVLKDIQEADKSAFIDKEQREAEKGRAKFGDTTGKHVPPKKKIPMSQLMKMKNENPDLNIDDYI